MNQDQYNILNQRRTTFELIAGNHDAGALDGAFLLAMQSIYSDVFNAKKPNIGCGACIKDAIKKLYPELLKYEATTK